MNLIVFCEGQEIKKRLIHAVRAASLQGSLEICRSPCALYKRLRQPRLYQTIVVLSAHQQQTLESLVNEKALIREVRSIVVLFNDDMESIIKAHLLHPRFVIFQEDIPEELPLVLVKMTDNLNMKWEKQSFGT